MSACTFFGHRDCLESIKPALYSAVENLITSNGVRTFYVGNHGNFDRLAASVLRDMKALHPESNITLYSHISPRRPTASLTLLSIPKA